MVEDRIRAALREIATSGNAWDARERPAPRRWPAATLAGLAVAAIVAVVALLPAWTGGNPRPVTDGGQPTLPKTFPAYAFGQGVMAGPFGRAIAMYHNGTGHEDWSFSQLIVAGADENRVRRVPVPEAKRGDQLHARLSPDGTKVVAGGRGSVKVIDLMTGATKDYPTSTPTSIAALYTAPRALSADSRKVAFVAYREFPEEGTLYVLDLDSGQISPELAEDARAVAFSPDGRLAVQVGSTVRIVELPGTVGQEFDLEGDKVLAGPQAWTPDGRFLVIVHTGPARQERNLIYPGPQSFVFVPMTGAAAPRPIPADDLVPRAWGDHVLGWRSPTRMLVSGGDVNGTTSNLIQEVEITTGAHEIISRFRVGADDDLAVTDVQLATGLLAQAGMRSGAWPDRGPWPTWLIVTVVLFFVPFVATLLFTRQRVGSNAARSTPPAPKSTAAPEQS